jgi:hypothetical protein
MNPRIANRIYQLLTCGSNLAIREHCTVHDKQQKETGTLVVEMLEQPAKLESMSTEEVTGEASGEGEVQVGQGEGNDSVWVAWFQGGSIVNWERESFVRGGYTYPSVNAHGARSILAAPLEKRVFFADEE